MIPDKFFENKTRVILCLLLPAFCLYFKSLHYEFTTLDEQWMIVNNADFLKGWKSLHDAFTRSITGLYYRPLLLTSIFLDYKIGGLSPAIYHFTNIILHLCAVLLVFKFLCINNVSKQVAFIFTLLFSVHPVILHAVAWVPGRNDLLLCIFTLGAIIFLLEYLLTQQKKYLVFHLVFFICALLTKETAILLPLIFTAFYVVYHNTNLKKIIPFVIAWITISLLWFLLRNFIVEIPPPPTRLSYPELIKNFISALLLYIGKTVVPVQQSILPMVKNYSLVPGILTLTLLVTLIFKPGIKDKKVALLGLNMFFFILALPVWVSAVKNSAEHYEHRIYTAMVGLLLFFPQLRFNFKAKFFYYLSGLIFIFYCFRTYYRMDVYKNKETFINAGVKEVKGNYLFLFQKTEILFKAQKYDSALIYCSQALAIRPDKSQIYGNRGAIYYALGNYKAALSDFSKAITLSKTFDYNIYLNRCVCYEYAGDINNALKDLFYLKKCCQSVIPPFIEQRLIEKYNTQVNNVNEKIIIEPKQAENYFNRATLYFSVNDEEKGMADIKKATSLEPSNKKYLQLYMLHYEKKAE